MAAWIAVALVVVGGAAYLARPGASAPGARAVPAPVAPGPRSLGEYMPAPGQAIPFEVCYYNGAWSPPDTDTQAAHLQSDSRYRTMDPARLQPERVHLELGPFRANAALSDFVTLSGLWTDPHATALTCPAELTGRAELWSLQLRVERVELSGADVTAFVAPRAGFEVVQVSVPAQAEALHVIDATDARQAPDANLRLR